MFQKASFMESESSKEALLWPRILPFAFSTESLATEYRLRSAGFSSAQLSVTAWVILWRPAQQGANNNSREWLGLESDKDGLG